MLFLSNREMLFVGGDVPFQKAKKKLRGLLTPLTNAGYCETRLLCELKGD